MDPGPVLESRHVFVFHGPTKVTISDVQTFVALGMDSSSVARLCTSGSKHCGYGRESE